MPADDEAQDVQKALLTDEQIEAALTAGRIDLNDADGWVNLPIQKQRVIVDNLIRDAGWPVRGWRRQKVLNRILNYFARKRSPP
jgi:hypothetical protein